MVAKENLKKDPLVKNVKYEERQAKHSHPVTNNKLIKVSLTLAP